MLNSIWIQFHSFPPAGNLFNSRNLDIWIFWKEKQNNQLINQLIIMQIKYCYNFDTKEERPHHASWLITVITDQHVNNRDNYEDVNCRSERWSLRQNQSQVAVTRWQFRCITEDHYINISCWPVQCARIIIYII